MVTNAVFGRGLRLIVYWTLVATLLVWTSKFLSQILLLNLGEIVVFPYAQWQKQLAPRHVLKVYPNPVETFAGRKNR